MELDAELARLLAEAEDELLMEAEGDFPATMPPPSRPHREEEDDEEEVGTQATICSW